MFLPRLEVARGSSGPAGGGSTGTCYVTGTRLAVPEGAVAVEDLMVGTMVLTAGGEPQPVRWIGHRKVNCSQAKEPATVWPICIQAGAFADGQPSRDLWVSPGHHVLVADVLIPADKLVNGATIVQVPQERVHYWHVELDRHDVVLAEDLPAESYLDVGNRSAFINGGAFIDAHPDFKPKKWAEACAPQVLEGELVERVRTSLVSRAQQHLGYEISAESDAHIVADGRRVEPVHLSEHRLAFLLPAQCSTIELRSRSFVPAHVLPGNGDARLLGVCVGRLQVDGVDLPLEDDATFADGWHPFESDSEGTHWRWSRERAPLPASSRLIVVDVVGRGYYWVRPSAVPCSDSVAVSA
jgi:Hint domain